VTKTKVTLHKALPSTLPAAHACPVSSQVTVFLQLVSAAASHQLPPSSAVRMQRRGQQPRRSALAVAGCSRWWACHQMQWTHLGTAALQLPAAASNHAPTTRPPIVSSTSEALLGMALWSSPAAPPQALPQSPPVVVGAAVAAGCSLCARSSHPAAAPQEVSRGPGRTNDTAAWVVSCVAGRGSRQVWCLPRAPQS
jgi:hypothetical protein